MVTHRQLLALWFLVWDLFVLNGLCFLTLGREVVPHLPGLNVLAIISLAMMKLYSIHRLRRAREELLQLLQSAAIFVVLLSFTHTLPASAWENQFRLVSFIGIGWLVLFLVRRFWWFIIGSMRQQGFNPTPVVIVGTGRVARRTARAIERAGWTGFHLLGYIEDEPNRWSSDLNVIGRIEELPRMVLDRGISQVFIALPMNRYHEARRVFDVLSQSIVEVRLMVDAPRLAALSLATTNIDGLTVVGLRENPHHGINVAVKRVMDMALSLLALILLSPLLLIIAVGVKLSSPGPVFYRQERCGLNGRRFMMLKFRSMPVNVESSTGPVWAKPGEQRATRFGSWLRRTSLDELPQLINVLIGDMSLVGPRPERPVFIERFRQTIPNYMARHMVKSGLTGWAQVQGWRGNTSLRQRIRHDLYYITHWNPWFDLRILFLTMAKGLFQKNAY